MFRRFFFESFPKIYLINYTWYPLPWNCINFDHIIFSYLFFSGPLGLTSRSIDEIWRSFEVLGCYAQWVNCGTSVTEENVKNRGLGGENADKAALEDYIKKLKSEPLLKI